MLDAFYGAFSPACLALLGLWLVAVQMRADEVRASRELRRRTYAIALFFALPGLMGVIALIDTADPAFWRVSFVIISLVGAAVLFPVRGLPGGARVRDIADIAAVMLYLAIAVLAVIGGADMQRTVAVLLDGPDLPRLQRRLAVLVRTARVRRDGSSPGAARGTGHGSGSGTASAPRYSSVSWPSISGRRIFRWRHAGRSSR